MAAKKKDDGDGHDWMEKAKEAFRAGETNFHPEFDLSDAELGELLEVAESMIALDPDPEKRTTLYPPLDLLTMRHLVMSAIHVKAINRNYWQLTREVQKAFAAFEKQLKQMDD